MSRPRFEPPTFQFKNQRPNQLSYPNLNTYASPQSEECLQTCKKIPSPLFSKHSRTDFFPQDGMLQLGLRPRYNIPSFGKKIRTLVLGKKGRMVPFLHVWRGSCPFRMENMPLFGVLSLYFIFNYTFTS